MDWQQEKYDPPHGPSDPGQWQVHMALAGGDVEAIQEAAPKVAPAEHVEVHTELIDGVERDATLALRVYATSSDEATEAASHTDAFSNLRIMTRTQHRLGGNYRANHP